MYEGRCSFGSAMKRQTPAITFPLFKFNHSFSSASKGESFFAPDWANLLYSDADEPLQPPLVSPISLQLSTLNRFPSHRGWISLGPLNGFSRPLNRFLGIGSNFSHSPAEWWWQEQVSIFNPGDGFQIVTLRRYNLIFLISSAISDRRVPIKFGKSDEFS